MSRQALELALEALERSVATCFDQRSHDAVMGRPKHFVNQTITAIKEALAQPEPVATVESVATVVSESGNQEVTMSWWHEPALPVGIKLYTAPPQGIYYTPPQRTWVGLTDEEIAEFAERMEASDPTDSFWREFSRAIEAKLKDKNEN